MRKTILVVFVLLALVQSALALCNFQGSFEGDEVSVHRQDGTKIGDADIYELGKYSVNIFWDDVPVYFKIDGKETEQGMIESCDSGRINWLNLTVKPESVACDYYVGETISLPQLTAVHQLDQSPDGDGVTTWLFCSWDFADQYQAPTLMSDQFCGGSSYTFDTDGSYNYTILIAYATYHGEELVEQGFEDPLIKEYKVCYRGPSQTQLEQLIALLIQAICAVFPGFGFC